jgi:hypothetical protein
MSEQPPATKRAAPRRRNVGRALGNIAVAIVILAVMAGAFALSYTPVRDIARDAGVASPVVRIYPGILDAVFLVCCACALMLRNARWWTRLYAWLSVLVTGALIGAAGVYHATGLRLPRRTLDGTVWALPWALVLLGFSLWISTLQHTKSDRDPGAAEPDDRPAPDAPVLVLEATPPARVALPAPQAEAEADEASATPPAVAESAAAEPTAVDSRARTGGLAEVGLGRPAMAREVAQAEPAQAEQAPEPAEPAKAEETAGAEQVVTTEAAEVAEQPAVVEEAPVVAEPPATGQPAVEEAPVVTEAPVAGETSVAGESAEAAKPEAAGAAEEAGQAEEAGETPEPQAEEAEEAGQAPEVKQADDPGTPSTPEESQEARESQEPEEAGTELARGAGESTGTEPAGQVLAGHEAAEAPQTADVEATTPAPAAATPVAISTPDDDTPAYGFPVVTEQDVDRELPRMPTLLGAPVPADMTEAAAADPAAKGKPPAASAELPVDEAELAHEDQPGQEPAAPAQSTPPETPAPTRFERVRSTPTRPSK